MVKNTRSKVSASALCLAVAILIPAGALAQDTAKPEEGIPAELKGFQGMMTGKLIKKGDTSLVFKVEKIMKVWKGNKAENPKKAVGKILKLNLAKVSDHHSSRIMKHFQNMKEGDQIELEAFDLGQKTLCIKEWLRKVGAKK